MTTPPWLSSRTIYLTRHGSHAYGTATPQSDLDLRGIAIPPKAYFLGYAQRFEQATQSEPDLVIFDIRKFFALAANGNPNVLELLWTDPEDHQQVTPLGETLLAHRYLFLSRRLRHTFSGYAVSQLKRIQGHRQWLLHPPQQQPRRSDFSLPERGIIPREQLRAAEHRIQQQLDTWEVDLEPLDPPTRLLVREQMSRCLAEIGVATDTQWQAAARTVGFNENFIEFLDRERKYRTQKQQWKQYQTWKAERNPQRAALEAKHGYDCKHASHLVRLLRMCREVLETGELYVRRPDHEELLAIRNGAWTYEQLLTWANEQNALVDVAVANSPLPPHPDQEQLDALCCSLVERALAGELK